MRYYVVSGLKKGVTLAQPVFGERSEVVYSDGQRLMQKEIDMISRLGYPGVYVEDPRTVEVVPQLLLPRELYLGAVAALKYFMDMAKHGERSLKNRAADIERQRNVVSPIIEVLKQKKRRIIECVEGKPFREYDNYHAVSVMVLSLLVGIEGGMTDEKLYELGVAALLHDIGNAFLPAEILGRPGELTDEEYELVKKHVQMGYEYLHGYHELSPEASMGALQHHENYDGTGYPNKLKRKQISLVGRIIAVADVYDALVSRRPYRAAKYANEALDVLEQASDRKFDPDIVNVFMKFVAPFPGGVPVLLTTGEQAIVCHNYAESLRRPKLLLLEGNKIGEYLDLSKDPGLEKVKIRKIVE
jgi:HD-GYP domain-containing protein (c-di-GMP phosphodiesterase class II)